MNPVLNNIKRIRLTKNLTQEYIATKLNITQEAYSKIESGETNISLKHLGLISETLEVPLHDLLDSEGMNVYNNTIHTNKGEGGMVVNSAKFATELYNQLLAEKDKQIEILKADNAFLKNLLNKNLPIK